MKKNISPDGYVRVLCHGHPKESNAHYVHEHVLLCEEILGKFLPLGAIIHHINENRKDNKKENLVICQDRAYHILIHKRMKAFKKCNNPNWEKCAYCKQYDNPLNLIHPLGQTHQFHSLCNNKYHKEYYKKNKIEIIKKNVAYKIKKRNEGRKKLCA